MENQVITLITSILSIFISVATILGFLLKFSNRIFYKAACRAFEEIKPDDLDPRSEMHKVISSVNNHQAILNKLQESDESRESQLAQMKLLLDEISQYTQEAKRAGFKSDLRSRLEYTIMKRGKVDESYWTHIADDYTYYREVLKMNTYMGSLYTEAERLHIKLKITNEQK